MKQLLRKLIAGVDKVFLTKPELTLLKKIDPKFLSKNSELLRLNSKYKPGVIKKTKSDKYLFIGLDESDPLLIDPSYLHEAKENDLVLVQRIMGRNKKSDASVVANFEAEQSYSVGIIKKDAEDKKIFADLHTAIPVDYKASSHWVEAQELGALFLFDNKSKTVLQSIGNIDDPHVDEKISLARYNRQEAFSDAAIAEVKKFDLHVDASLHRDRVDLRHLNFSTIDPVTAKDFDDAICYDAENQILYVAIADVSHYVTLESELDAEAYKRGFSIYFPHKSIPMLPRELSETLCSLQPNLDRLSFVFEIHLNLKEVSVKFSKVYEAIIHSKRRFNYDEIDAYMEGKPAEGIDKEILDALFPLQAAMDQFREKRMKNGYNFRSPEIEMYLDSEGMITDTAFAKATPSHALIEDCMLLANIEAANFTPNGLFRVHEAPSLAKLDQLYNQLNLMGLQFKISANLKETITSIQDAADKIGKRESIDTLLIQTQMQAHYSPQNLGHFGLGFKAYAHFTSPIRRYSDLIVHRLIKAHQKSDIKMIQSIEQTIDAIAIDVSIKEREASAVANDFARRKYARYALKHLNSSVKAEVIHIAEISKAQSIEPITGMQLSLYALSEEITLFDLGMFTLDEANLENCEIKATFTEPI